MNIELSKRWTRRWEGVRRRVYHDTKGIPTIGVGCNLTTQWARHTLTLFGIDYEGVLAGTISLTDEQIDNVLGSQLAVASSDIHQVLPDLYTYPEPQQIVIVDLSFNMGIHVLSSFKKTLASIEAQDWTGTAANLKLSSWYVQVGQRARANVAVLGGTATIESFL